ncbi:MAG: hypothetical protein AAFQ98_18175 [Bacteroidota bacterium]
MKTRIENKEGLPVHFALLDRIITLMKECGFNPKEFFLQPWTGCLEICHIESEGMFQVNYGDNVDMFPEAGKNNEYKIVFAEWDTVACMFEDLSDLCVSEDELIGPKFFDEFEKWLREHV